MDFSHDSMDDWHSWADLCQWTPDWTYYAHNSATPTSGAFEAFEGGWSSDMGRTTGAIEPRNTDDGGQVWQEAHVRVQEGSFSTSTYQASLQRESSITSHTTVTEAFPDLSTTYKTDPAPLCGLEVHRQKPRFAGDLYTALWVRGEGTERAGWCGFCSTWHKLKDSAYNYHMHFTHGIICATGRQVNGPQSIQCQRTWQVLCGGCNSWIDVGQGDRAKARTA